MDTPSVTIPQVAYYCAFFAAKDMEEKRQQSRRHYMYNT